MLPHLPARSTVPALTLFLLVQKKAAAPGKRKRKAAAPDGGKVKSGKKGKAIALTTAAEVAAAGTPQET